MFDCELTVVQPNLDKVGGFLKCQTLLYKLSYKKVVHDKIIEWILYKAT